MKTVPVVCSCDEENDEDMERVRKVLARLERGTGVTDAALVRAIGEVEATSHARTCAWTGLLLEECERRWMGLTPKE